MIKANVNQKKVKHPYDYNFIKITNPHLGHRKLSTGERLAQYMNNHGLTIKRFSKIATEFGIKKGIRVTERDIRNYLYMGESPKVDKLYAITQAMGVTIDYFCGYGAENRKSKHPWLAARYNAKRKK